MWLLESDQLFQPWAERISNSALRTIIHTRSAQNALSILHRGAGHHSIDVKTHRAVLRTGLAVHASVPVGS